MKSWTNKKCIQSHPQGQFIGCFIWATWIEMYHKRLCNHAEGLFRDDPYVKLHWSILASNGHLSSCIEGSLPASISRKEGRLAADFKGGIICPSQAWPRMVNSLASGSCGGDLKGIISKLILQNSSMDTCWKIVLRWMPQNTFSDKSTLV